MKGDPDMPEAGRLNPASVEALPRGDDAKTPWTAKGVAIHQATFEIDTEAALNALAPMLTRPAPTYGRIYVIDYPESPVGPYKEALLLVSCRYLMLPRQYLAASIVTSEAAAAANLAGSHYRSEVGSISLERGNLSARSVVEGPGGLRLTIDSPEAEPTGPDVLRYDPIVVAQPGDGGLKVITVSAAPENLRDAFIAAGTTVALTGGGTPWQALRSLNPITGTFALMDLEVPEPKEVEMPPMMAAAAARQG
jgi:hypothetical protein